MEELYEELMAGNLRDEEEDVDEDEDEEAVSLR